MTQEDRELAAAFKREAERIAVPERARRTGRIPLRRLPRILALATLGVLAVVVVAPALTALRTPTALASPSSNTAQPSGAGVASDRYGWIDDARPPLVRAETTSTTIVQLRGDFFHGAVSPDGRRIAYWETYSSPEVRTLWLVDAAGTTQPRMLLTLANTEIAAVSAGDGVVWSSDGTGLLIAVNSLALNSPAPPVDATPQYATLRQLDIATGSVREIARNQGVGAWFEPIAWDRDLDVSAAVEIGPGGFVSTYIVVRDGSGLTGTPLPEQTLARYVRASVDARSVLMRGFFEHRAVYVWPLAEPTQVTTFRASGSEYVVAALWRAAGEIVVSLASSADATTGERLEIWAAPGQRRQLVSAPLRLDAVRPDGSAAVTDKGVVDLRTGVVDEAPRRSRAIASVLVR